MGNWLYRFQSLVGAHLDPAKAHWIICVVRAVYGPAKIWRHWHKKISVNQRRYAVSSALAASATPTLVIARGHRIDNVPGFPLVSSDFFGGR